MTTESIDNYINENTDPNDQIGSLINLCALHLKKLDALNKCGIPYGDTYYIERAKSIYTNASVRDFRAREALWATTAALILDVANHPDNERFNTAQPRR